MQPIKETVNTVMTEIKTLRMNPDPATTPPQPQNPNSDPNSDPRALPNFQGFETFKEHGLETMVREARTFRDDVKLMKSPRWISFLGTSGAGKTFLAGLIFDALKDQSHIRSHKILVHGAQRVEWPKLIGELYSQKFWVLDDYSMANLLLIDDISAANDAKGFEREMLWRLLASRMDKWTVITSNLLLPQIRDTIDTRIASRLTRDRNVVVEVKTTDYQLR